MSEGSDKGVTIEYPDESTVNIIEETNKQPQLFTLDRVFNPDTKQEDIFNLASDSINDVIEGFNATIFAYGQTGSGKSFTMFGPSIEEEELCGIIPRACKYIFDYIHSDSTGIEFTIKCSFLEIYKEDVKDLLNPSSKKSLRIRESASKGVWVEGLYESCVTSVSEIMDLLKTGERFRTVTSTNMNAVSSRSHSLFILTLIQKFKDGSIKTGKLNLADLAGSEKVGKTGAKGNTLEEAKKINQSLSSLGNCINALTQEKKAHVPYRDSKLTFILRESLGGNTKTTLIVACSPHPFNITETLSTLRFAQRAKTIKNTVTINAKRSVEELEGIIKGLLSELNDIKYYVKHLEKELSTFKGGEWNPEEEMKKVFENRNLNMPSLTPSNSESTNDQEVTLIPTPIKLEENNPVQLEMSKIENATQKDLSQIENQVRNDKLAEQLKEEIESLKDQLNSFKEEEQESKKQASNFKDSFHQKDEEFKKISHELQSIKQKSKTDSEKFEYDSKQLRYEIESCKLDLKMSLDKYNQLKEINSNQFLEIKNLEEQLNEIKKLKEEIDFKLREINSQFLQAQEKESQTELKYQEASNERNTYKKQSEQLNEEKRNLLENEKTLRSQLSKVQLLYEESKLEISSKLEEKEFVESNLNETINKLKQEVNELKQSLSNNSKENVVSVEDLKKKDLLLESTTNENVENKKKILNLQSLYAQKDLECKSIISQFEEFTVQTQSYIKLMEKSESDNNNKLNEKEEKIVLLQNGLQEAKSLVEQNKQKSFEVLREEINQWTNKLNKIEQDRKTVEEKLNETNSKLEEETKKALILKEKQESSTLRIKELEEKLEEAILNYDTTQIDLETALNLNIENAKKFERELQITEEGFKLREERRKNNIVKSIVNENTTSSPSRWFKKKDPLPIANTLGKVDKSGYLTKQGDWVRSWRKKWMVLKDDKIYIFDTPQDEKPKAQIELTVECFVQRADEYTNMEYSFGIYSNLKKVHFLKADSLDEVEEWMQEIANNVRQLTKSNN